MCDMFFFLTFDNYHLEVNFDSTGWLHGEQIGPSCGRGGTKRLCGERLEQPDEKTSTLFLMTGPPKACGFFSEK